MASYRGPVDLHFDTQVALHDLAQMVARGLEDLQPAVLPVADAGQPCRAAPARPRRGTSALQVQAPVLIEGVAAPDVAEARLPHVWKELGCTERDVLTTQRDPAERVDVEPLERPHTGLFPFGGQVLVQMPVQRLAERNGRVVVPREELARDDLVDTDLLEPEVHRRVELSLGRFLSDDRDHDPGRDLVLPAKRESRPNVTHVLVPPRLRIARRASVRRTQPCI